MRRLLSFLFFLLCSNAFAQEHHRLAGYVQMPGQPLNSYYLELTINGTKVTGYSITDYTGGNRLKASVTGHRDPESEMYIQETSSLDGPNAINQTYCYFSAHLKLSIFNGRQRWSGPFDSREADGTPCHPSSGLMTIMDNAPPLDAPKLRPAEPKPVPNPPSRMRVQQDGLKSVPPPKPVPQLPKPVPAPPKDTIKPLPKPELPKPKPKPVIVIPPPKAVPPPAPRDTNNCLRTYDWSTDSVSFDIRDGWTIDGDVVSISIGGRTLLDHVKLSEVKQHFSVPLAKGLNILVISLHDEGFEPPNTPNMTLYDGSKVYDLNISGNPGETARICINRTQ